MFLDNPCLWCDRVTIYLENFVIFLFPLMALSVSLLIASILRLIFTKKVSREFESIIQIDASHWLTSPPDILQPDVEKLIKLKFRRLGEAYFMFRGATYQTWFFVSIDESIVAGINLNPQMGTGLTMQTWYSNNALVETSYSNSIHIDEPTYISSGVSTSLPDVYQMHLKHKTEFNRKHGRPVRKNSISDVLVFPTKDHIKFRNKIVYRKSYYLPIAAHSYALIAMFSALQISVKFDIKGFVMLGIFAVLSLPYWWMVWKIYKK